MESDKPKVIQAAIKCLQALAVGCINDDWIAEALASKEKKGKKAPKSALEEIIATVEGGLNYRYTNNFTDVFECIAAVYKVSNWGMDFYDSRNQTGF
jgi:hypothetical protein